VEGKRVINFEGLQALGIPYCRTHIDRLEESGDFPESFKLGKGRGARRVWWLHEIIEWLEAKAANRDWVATKRAIA
jgi:predicted DNA-binding transcriptional regulator AlpA